MNVVDLRLRLTPLLARAWAFAADGGRWTADSKRSSGIRVMSRISLTATHSIHIVEADGQRMILGCHPRGFAVLGGPGVGEEES
jgi:flagellar biogenesis protein FliO